jgi:hypothetical protein
LFPGLHGDRATTAVLPGLWIGGVNYTSTIGTNEGGEAGEPQPAHAHMRDAHLIVTTTTPSASSYMFRNFRVDHASMHGLILHYSVATRLYGLWYTRVGLFMSMSISVCASGTTHDTTRRRKALLISHCWSELIASV